MKKSYSKPLSEIIEIPDDDIVYTSLSNFRQDPNETIPDKQLPGGTSGGADPYMLNNP